MTEPAAPAATQPTITDAATQATLLVEELSAALVNARIYAADHPRVLDAIGRVQRLARELALTSCEDPVRIGSADGLIVFQQRPLLGASYAAARLIDVLQRWGSGGIELGSQATQTELEHLFVALAGRPEPGAGLADLNAALGTRGYRNVRLLPPYVDPRASVAAADTSNSTIRMAVRLYQQVIDLLQNVTVAVCRGGTIEFGSVQTEAEAVLKRLESGDGPLLGLARHDQYDAFTFGHSVRVAVLSLNFARALTDDHDMLVRIGVAALLHDVGKSLIPFELLHTSRTLDEDEQREMRRHPELGAEILLDHNDSDPLAVAAAFGHHRAADGSGYPCPPHGHRTMWVTDLIKICDVYEALTAARPYKNPMSPIRAYRVMLAMGHKLDQALLRRFIEVNGIYPVGQQVTLDSGEVAVVRAQTEDQLRPVVAVVQRADGEVVVPAEQELLDLSDIGCCSARAILGELGEPQPAVAAPGAAL